MEREGQQKKMRWGFPLGVVAAVVIGIASFYWLHMAGERAIQNTYQNINSQYIQKMSERSVEHFETDLENNIQQLRLLSQGAAQIGSLGRAELEDYLRAAQESGDVSLIVFVDEEGRCHGADGIRNDAPDAELLEALISGEREIISCERGFGGEKMILLGSAAEPFSYKGVTYTAVIAGFSIPEFEKRFGLLGSAGGSDLEVVMTWELAAGTGGADAVPTEETGYLTYAKEGGEAGGRLCYYALIPNTDLYMLTTFPQEAGNRNIEALLEEWHNIVLIACSLVFLIMIALFGIYLGDIKKGETKIRQADETEKDAHLRVEEANLSRSEFLSRISHEIRTPLNVIMGMNDIARMNLQDTEKVKDCLEKAAASSRQLLSLINDVLDMSQIESGKAAVGYALFNFRVLLEGIDNVFYSQSAAVDVDFEMILKGRIDESLFGDSMRLHQILSNLLSNAVKFTPAGGKVALKVEEIKRERERVWLRFQVTDNGCGIRDEDLDKIFEVFAHGAAETKYQYGGAGLGLPIVKRFSELMGGFVRAESSLGKGSTFTLELPFGTLETGKQAENAAYAKLHVLVVDRNQDTCEYLSGILRRLGVRRIERTTDKKEALSMAGRAREQGEAYDLCLLDWRIADTDGSGIVRDIRAGIKERGFLIVTVDYDTHEAESPALKAGADCVLTKPLFASMLAAVLERVDIERIGRSFPEAERKKDGGRSLKGKRILFAEDMEINREIMEELLGRNAGASIEFARDGIEAVERFQNTEPGYYDMILMDVQMPQMNGYEAAKAIRGLNRADAKTIPIFAMTADALFEDMEKSREAGMDAHLTKPLDLAEFYQKLDEVMQKKR